MTDNEARALEFQAMYGSARGKLDVSYLLNSPAASGICCVLSSRFAEEVANSGGIEGSVLLHDRGHAFLIG
ncbi:MAG TPA: hypothetical protein VMU75_08205 [Acidimicrobiales bacterium]|nr:hypothetical protein [Acidimicrobiales bacterium]